MRVLLVEPDTILAAVYIQALEQFGNEIQHAVSAQTAVQLADKALPDVVVLELQMPRHNGVEFLYEFRSYGEWQLAPIVLHTFAMPSQLGLTAAMQKELGVRQVLYKPATSLRQLCMAVQRVTASALL
jgi:CheY-like chemotaxis protein